MADYIYLLENRLSADQRHALAQLRTVAREAGFLLFLTGDAVRDLTSGHAVRELEVTVHGNSLKLRKPLEKLGASFWGEDEPSRSLYLCFPGTIRVNVVSAHRAEYPKPGKPVYHWTSIQEDLRRRDFTANAMAISLNEGSFGLLMDPLNGTADIEARLLRLVSNYGFLEEPSLLIRAIRYCVRLGWEMDPRTMTRYENAKAEGAIDRLSAHERSQELEQIGHEEEALKVLRALEAEGWMKHLFPAWTSAKADEAKLTALHELAVELQTQGVHPDTSAAQMQLLTAKMQPKDLAALKRAMLRPGFVEEWNHLDALAAGFAKALLAKHNAIASEAYKLFKSYDPEAILWLGFTSKDKAVQERFHLFLKVWPEARQRIPYALMQEMRITADLPVYAELIEKIFLELIDGRLTEPEQMRAWLEPYSPPAPAPQPSFKRSRARRAESRLKEEIDDEDVHDDDLEEDGDLDTLHDEEDLDLSILPASEREADDDSEEELDEGDKRVAPKPAPAEIETPLPAKKSHAKTAAKHPAAEVAAPKPAPKPVSNEKPAQTMKQAPVPAKPVPHKPQPASHNPQPASHKPQPASHKPQPAPHKPQSVPQKPQPAPKAAAVASKAAKPTQTVAKKSEPAKAAAVHKKPAKPAPQPKPAAKKTTKPPAQKPKSGKKR